MDLRSFLKPSSLLDLLFPSFCASCGSFLFGDHKFVACPSCWKEYFAKYSGKKCLNCGMPIELLPGTETLCRRCLEKGLKFSFDGIDFFTLYSGLPEVSIREMKFSRLKPVARLIGEEISQHIKEKIEEWKVDVVVPVPLGKGGLKERGFNQTEEILRGAGVEFLNCLEKGVKTKRQSELPKNERAVNIKGAFSVRRDFKREIFGKRILLFDDVFTTGATVNEISKVLKKSGALSVFVYTVCYTPLRKETGNLVSTS